MIASLGMYDWPELRAEHDRFWALIRDGLRARGMAAPEALDRQADLWDIWQDPDLVLGQTCGLPYRSRLHGRVGLVGTPDYALPDAPAGHYYSMLVVRADRDGVLEDFAGTRLAINGYDSQSGWAAPQNHARDHGIRFGDIVVTGAHRDSVRAVAEDRADIAAIDAVTWRLVQAFKPQVAQSLRVLGHTAPTPGLPLITTGDPEPLREAVAQAIADLDSADRAALGIVGLAAVPKADYLAVPTPAALHNAGSA